MKTNPLLDVETHFAFGENWADYSKLIDSRRIASAQESLTRLLGKSLDGLTFLDIGSGSGLFSLAASQLGAKRIVSIDIDPISVEATRRLRAAHGPNQPWDVQELSVFDATPERLGRFDVVYSWGVLHHTGDMWRALRAATCLVDEKGMLAIALYIKTPFCGFWKVEKRFYTNAPRPIRWIIYHTYKLLADAYSIIAAKRNATIVERGMDQDHDYKDWLGGFPYESASPDEVDVIITQLGFKRIKTICPKARSGLMGTGCAEYVYQRM